MRSAGTPLLITDNEQLPLLAIAREQGWRVLSSSRVQEPDAPHDVALAIVSSDERAAAVAVQYPEALLIGSAEGLGHVELVLPRTADRVVFARLLQRARRHWYMRRDSLQLARELQLTRHQMELLADVGCVLSSQIEPNRLLETILTEARRIAGCEAGSLYLVDDQSRALLFKLAQNDAIAMMHREMRLPLSPSSVAGYVALTGHELNIDDAYRIPEEAPYRFNRSFDVRFGYRTRSMLVLPMRDHRARVVGVLQFINRRAPGETSGEPIGFDERVTALLRAIASQAAVSIQKNALLADINRLFEDFVLASVRAIERRDPSTSGHSFRVAESTLALLTALPDSGNPRFRDLVLSPEHLQEVRYAALLHDFGKVAVPERVLLKANKLTDERLEVLRYRCELQKERFRRNALEQELALLHKRPADFAIERRRIHRELERRITLLDDYLAAIVRANRPTILEDGDFAHLRSIRDHAFVEPDGSPSTLISESDLVALSVRRGTLTADERREIEAHVGYTRVFLAALPWPPELAGVPAIAAAHHEKLDGSGYPDGLIGDAIPLPSRVMTVCDIYDALTAMDRPYKAAMPVDAALTVLEDEARRGLLDADIVRVFVQMAGSDPINGLKPKETNVEIGAK
jgi:HD-GYP domain-containing protein (c-di-GMP phosphodiesterase class II)